MGELSYRHMFVDGTKIEANANRYTFVWAKAVAKQLEKLEVRIAKEVPPVARRYELPADTSPEDCLAHLMRLANLVNLTFVSGKGRHKIQLQRDIELLTRGKRKTETQFFLLAFAYNIRKLCNRPETGRFGVALFDVDVA